ncbi:MAG: tetratricopeptide repeat protein, partial [Thermoanaerobaculales bacterium]|nr:tetratricopeptide repeat protein [Thermoanaerobaculales bacterium]
MHGRSQHRKGIGMLRKSLVFGAILMTATLVLGEVVPNDQANGLPNGLELYLEARVLESNGRYREAMEAYAAAVEEAPEVNEIRLAFATFLVDVGMADRAVEVLDGAPDPGPEGHRIVALALAQLSSRNPALLTKTEAALRLAIESNEGDPSLLFSLAQVLQRQNKFAEAEEIA